MQRADTDAMVRETIRFYDRNAEAFWSGTRDHDVSQNRDTLLGYIEADHLFGSWTLAADRVAICGLFCAWGMTPPG